MNALGVTLVLFASGLVLFGRPVIAALGVMFAVCYLTQAQAVEIAGFNFTAIRIVLLVGAARVLMSGKLRAFQSSPVDKWLAGYAFAALIVAYLAQGSELVPFYLGVIYNVLLSYFVFRGFLKSWPEVIEFLSLLGLLIVPMALSMLYESATGYNMFKNLGGIKDLPALREGAFRCQGAFRISITAGVFGATLVPVFAGLYMAGRHRTRAAAGILSGLVITLTSMSSGPMMAVVNGVVALGLWRFRTNMRTVRWVIVAGFLCLSLFMNAPIYYMFARLADFIGGHGWHRARLIEQFVNHFDDWWLAGTTETGDWMPTALHHGEKLSADLTNKFVAVGVEGGLLPFVLFIGAFIICFKVLGRALRVARESSREQEVVLWSLGCAFFAHVMTLTSVQYWDQMENAFYMLFALIAGSVGYVTDVQDSKEDLTHDTFADREQAEAYGI